MAVNTNPRRDYPPTGTVMSVDEYFALDNLDVRYEFDDGVIRMMSGGSKNHDDITFNVRAALKMQLASGPCFANGPNLRTQVSPNKKYYYPDCLVSCDVDDRRGHNNLVRSPRIVVEVLSPGTEAEDRGKKLRAYQSCPTIMEYVLVSQYAQHVEVYRRDSDGTWHDQPVIFGEGSVVVLESIDVMIPIGEFYDGVDFTEFAEEE